MKKKGLELVLSYITIEDLTEGTSRVSVDATFMRDGKEIDYGQVTTDEKAVFANVCMQNAGILAKMALAEKGLDENGNPIRN